MSQSVQYKMKYQTITMSQSVQYKVEAIAVRASPGCCQP
jgi:hypothetical protein